ncbi:MAG TPA: hypothetical protein VI685_28420 [Candidatus Angelobacter sp.]
MALTRTTVALVSIFVTASTTLIPAYWKYSSDQQTAQQTIDKLQKQPGKVSTAQGTYEWQWAGDRWKGYVTVDGDGAASISMMMYADCPGGRRKLQLLEQQGNGKVTLLDDSTRVHVSIPVQFITYDDKCNKTGYEPNQKVLDGYLDQKIAYAGPIGFRATAQGGSPGDMILIKGYASGDH